MFKQRLMLGFAAVLAASLAMHAETAQCRGGGGGGGRMGSMGGQMGMGGCQGGGGRNGMMGNQMGMMGGRNAMMGGPMMNGQMQQGQGQGQGGGGMCMGQMGGQMGSNTGNLSANSMGRPRGPGGQTPNGIYAQVLPSAGTNQSGSGARPGQTLQQSVLATYDANGSGKLEGSELKAAQAAASQRRHRSRN